MNVFYILLSFFSFCYFSDRDVVSSLQAQDVKKLKKIKEKKVTPSLIYQWLQMGATFNISEQNITDLFCSPWSSADAYGDFESVDHEEKSETYEEAIKPRKANQKEMVDGILAKQQHCVLLVLFPDGRRFFIFESEILDSENPILKVRQKEDDPQHNYFWRGLFLWSPYYTRQSLLFTQGVVFEQQPLKSSHVTFFAFEVRAHWREVYERKSFFVKWQGSSLKRSFRLQSTGEVYQANEFQYKLDGYWSTDIFWEHEATIRPFVGFGLYHRQKTFWYETQQGHLGRRAIKDYGGHIVYRLTSGRKSGQQKELSIEYSFSIFAQSPKDFRIKNYQTHDCQVSFVIHKIYQDWSWGPYAYILNQKSRIIPISASSVSYEQRVKQTESRLGMKIGLSF
jgi:hypothetical protein